MSGIKHVKIKDPKKYLALFRRSTNELHLLLDSTIDTDDDSKMSYNDDIFELVKADTFEALFTDGKTKGDAAKMKTICDFWDPSWD